MAQNDLNHYSVDTVCPVADLLHALSAKWMLPVRYQLHRAEDPMLFCLDRDALRRITQTELTKTPRAFGRLGIVERSAADELTRCRSKDFTP